MNQQRLIDVLLHTDGTLNTYMVYDMKNNGLKDTKIYWYCISILRIEMV